MAEKTEYIGNDVDDAIRKACLQLNLPMEKLEIEVLATGTTGIFGLGKKKARILVSKKGNGDASETGKELLETKAVFNSNKAHQQEQNRKRVEKKPVRITQEIMDAIRDDISQMLTLMGFSYTVGVSQNGEKVMAKISGDGIEEIIGQDGKTLDGLQYIARKIISKKFPEKIMFALDAGDFREERARELEELALKLALEVKETSKTRSIQALNPAERRIVHMVLQNDKEIRSRSVGEGLFKRILIYLPGKGRKKTSPRRKGQRRKS